MIWRQVLVPESYTLHELQGVIQAVMGRESLHLFDFIIRAVRHGSPDLCSHPPDVILAANRLGMGT